MAIITRTCTYMMHVHCIPGLKSLPSLNAMPACFVLLIWLSMRIPYYYELGIICLLSALCLCRNDTSKPLIVLIQNKRYCSLIVYIYLNTVVWLILSSIRHCSRRLPTLNSVHVLFLLSNRLLSYTSSK